MSWHELYPQEKGKYSIWFVSTLSWSKFFNETHSILVSSWLTFMKVLLQHTTGKNRDFIHLIKEMSFSYNDLSVFTSCHPDTYHKVWIMCWQFPLRFLLKELLSTFLLWMLVDTSCMNVECFIPTGRSMLDPAPS